MEPIYRYPPSIHGREHAEIEPILFAPAVDRFFQVDVRHGLDPAADDEHEQAARTAALFALLS